jgi:hypothetical protein
MSNISLFVTLENIAKKIGPIVVHNGVLERFEKCKSLRGGICNFCKDGLSVCLIVVVGYYSYYFLQNFCNTNVLVLPKQLSGRISVDELGQRKVF